MAGLLARNGPGDRSAGNVGMPGGFGSPVPRKGLTKGVPGVTRRRGREPPGGGCGSPGRVRGSGACLTRSRGGPNYDQPSPPVPEPHVPTPRSPHPPRPPPRLRLRCVLELLPLDPPLPVSLGPDGRAAILVGAMTQDEKLQLIHGIGGYLNSAPRGAAGSSPALPGSGFPDLYLVDGSVGVGNGVGGVDGPALGDGERRRLGPRPRLPVRRGDGEGHAGPRRQRPPRWKREPRRAGAAQRPGPRDEGRGSHPGRAHQRGAPPGHAGPERRRHASSTSR